MTISVLLVEDHKIVREGTRQLLEQSTELRVVGEASNGLEAVKLAGEIHPDVIVMDVRLPGLNGIDATRAITASYPGIKVLILSAFDDDNYVFPLLEAGASGYLLKTSSGLELVNAIKQVHDGETALSPRISAKIINRISGRHAYRKNNMPVGLTEREMDVLRAVAVGHANKEIGGLLGISAQTVQVHLRNIFGKLEVGNRSEAVAVAIRNGWITLETDDE